jgi:hypothetical protein
MHHIPQLDRHQIEFTTLDSKIAADNPDNNKALYRKRQEINEHIFGTIKRVWGYYYTNLKGLEKVNGEWSLIMTVYNIKRTLNILPRTTLFEKLKNWKPNYSKVTCAQSKTIALQPRKRIQIFTPSIAA